MGEGEKREGITKGGRGEGGELLKFEVCLSPTEVLMQPAQGCCGEPSFLSLLAPTVKLELDPVLAYENMRGERVTASGCIFRKRCALEQQKP